MILNRIKNSLKSYLSPYRVQLALLFIIYFLTARFGLMTNAVNNFAALVWPPTGLALAALIIYGLRLWPSVFAAAFLVNLLAGASFFVALGIGVGNTLEAIAGAYLCTRLRGFHRSLDRREDVVRFILFAAIMSTLISATFGVTSLWLGGLITEAQLQITALQWWVGDMLGAVTITPLLLVFSAHTPSERFAWKKSSLLEKLAFALTLSSGSIFILSGKFNPDTFLFFGTNSVYPLLIILLWASMRFGQRGAVIAAFVMSNLAIWFTAQGQGVFVSNTTGAHLLHLSIFVFIAVVTSLIIGAVVTEKERERKDLELSKALVEDQALQLKNREIEFQYAKEAAEAANSAKSEFLANMSHEIRTPLGAVLGFAELMLDQGLTDKEKLNAVEVIKRNGRLLSNIINDILDLSKVEAGKLEIENMRTSLKELFSDINSLLNIEAAKKDIRLTIRSIGDLPQYIETDPLRLRQVLLNVVGNAIKFTDSGSVDVTIQVIPDVTHSLKLAFVVSDTGRGLSPEQVERIFSPFAQADASITRKYGGTGLGLILSKKLAKALGGDVVLNHSTPGVGSTFTITIDAGKIKFSEHGLDTRESQSADNSKIKNQVTGLKVLIVDDNADNQFLIQRLLKLEGIQVDIATGGRDGVTKAKEFDFDAVLMDLQMPEMDGYEAMRELRKIGYKKPIIAVTAHALKEEYDRCIASGFNDHISKPIDRSTLIKSLERHTHQPAQNFI